MRTLPEDLFTDGALVASVAKPKKVYDAENRAFTDAQEMSEIDIPLWTFTVGVRDGVLVQPVRVVVESETRPDFDIGTKIFFFRWEIYIAGDSLAIRCDGYTVSREEKNYELLFDEEK